MARQARDLVLKWLLRDHAEAVLDLLGLRDVAAIVGPAPTELPQVTVRGHLLDYLLALADGTYLHLEPQSGPAELDRLHVYDALLYRQDHRRIRTVVVYASPVREAADTLDTGCARYRVENVYLGAQDGDAALAALGAKVAAGAALSRQDVVRLAFVPLMGLRQRSMAAAEALRLARGIADAAERQGCQAAIVGLASRVLDEAAAAQLMREVRGMPDLLVELLAEGRAEGRAEGELHRARVWLLEAFSARFQDPPAALREAVERTSDLERLSRWLRAVVAAPDAAAAVAAVLRER